MTTTPGRLQGRRLVRRYPPWSTSREIRGGAYRGGGSESFIMMLPGGTRSRWRPPIVYCHGGGGVARDIYNDFLSGMAEAFVRAGYPLIVADLGGGYTWGNDDSQTAIGQAITYGGSQFGTRTDRVNIWLDSHGGVMGLRWAARNIGRVGWVYGSVPVVGLANLRLNPVFEVPFGSTIDTAFGGNPGYLAALPDVDPTALGQANVLRSLGHRFRIDADANDIYVLNSQYNAFLAVVPGIDFRWYPGNHFYARRHDMSELTHWAHEAGLAYG